MGIKQLDTKYYNGGLIATINGVNYIFRNARSFSYSEFTEITFENALSYLTDLDLEFINDIEFTSEFITELFQPYNESSAVYNGKEPKNFYSLTFKEFANAAYALQNSNSNGVLDVLFDTDTKDMSVNLGEMFIDAFIQFKNNLFKSYPVFKQDLNPNSIDNDPIPQHILDKQRKTNHLKQLCYELAPDVTRVEDTCNVNVVTFFEYLLHKQEVNKKH